MSAADVTLTRPALDDWLDQEGFEPAGRQLCGACLEVKECQRCHGYAMCDDCLRKAHAAYVAEEAKTRELLAALDPTA